GDLDRSAVPDVEVLAAVADLLPFLERDRAVRRRPDDGRLEGHALLDERRSDDLALERRLSLVGARERGRDQEREDERSAPRRPALDATHRGSSDRSTTEEAAGASRAWVRASARSAGP